MIEGTVRNPANPDHFMQLDRLEQRVRIFHAGREIATSDRALRLLESGRRLYQPQYYIPEADILSDLERIDRKTHCPLKGDAAYFDLIPETGERVEAIGWSYPEPFDFAAGLAGYIAFDPRRVTVMIEAAESWEQAVP